MRRSLPLTSANQLPDICAIYFVIDAARKVLYVGATKALRQRWKGHSRRQDFSAHGAVDIEWQFVRPKELAAKEQQAIKQLRPILNSRQTARYGHDATKPTGIDVHVYFPPKVLADLKKLAEQNRRSVTAEIVIAVEERLESAKNGKKSR